MCACTWYLVPAQAMSLYRYFKPTLPSPSGPLAESINPATIKAANEAVKDATSKPSKARGSCHVRIIRIIYPLYIRAYARARALRHRSVRPKLKNPKFYSKDIFTNFRPPKITRYTVVIIQIFLEIVILGIKF